MDQFLICLLILNLFQVANGTVSKCQSLCTGAQGAYTPAASVHIQAATFNEKSMKMSVKV